MIGSGRESSKSKSKSKSKIKLNNNSLSESLLNDEYTSSTELSATSRNKFQQTKSITSVPKKSKANNANSNNSNNINLTYSSDEDNSPIPTAHIYNPLVIAGYESKTNNTNTSNTNNNDATSPNTTSPLDALGLPSVNKSHIHSAANPQNIGNPFVYKVVKNLARVALGFEAFYEIFNFVYVKKAIETIGKIVGAPQVGAAAPYLSAVLTALDSGANLTMFDPEEEAETFSKALPDGFIKGSARYTISCVSSPGNFLRKGIPTLAMIINFPTGSYAEAEPIMQKLNEWIGDYKYIPVTFILVISSSYYLFSSGLDTLNGVEFLLNEGDQRLSPAQERLWQKVWYKKDFATPIQVAIESALQDIMRSVTFAFLGGRMVEQAEGKYDVDDENQHPASSAYTTMAIIAALATLITCESARGRKAYEKHYGKKGRRLDLITQEQINEQYQNKYGVMTWAQYLKTEFYRMLSPLGLAESVLPAYFASRSPAYLFGSVDDLQGWPIDIAMPIALGSMVALTMYLGIYRNADLRRELRNDVIDNQLKAEQKAANDQKIEAAKAQALTDGVTYVEPEEEKAPRESSCLKITAMLFAAGTQTARTLTSIPSMVGVTSKYTSLTIKDQTVLAASGAAAVQFSASSYNWMHDKSLATMQRYSTSAKKLFDSCVGYFSKPRVVSNNAGNANIGEYQPIDEINNNTNNLP
jgi:hypothetical protein